MRRSDLLGVLLAPVPALAVGALVMRGGDVPTVSWLSNLGAGAVGICVAALAWVRPPLPVRTRGFLGWGLFVGVILLGATLLAPGMEGVHRWLPLGPLRIHAGALLLPPLLVALREATWLLSAAVAIVILVVLSWQPDAAQAASFCAAWLVLGAARREPKATAVMVVSVLIAGSCLLRRDPLEPVPHVEGIVGMAAGQGPVLAWAGLLSLALLPLSFAVFLERPASLVLAVYTAGTLTAAWLGNHPVPVLGYGVSPILGYYGAVAVYALLRPTGETRPAR